MKKIVEYAISLREIEEDGEVMFEASVRELPDLREYGETAAEAHALMVDAITTTADVFAEKGKKMPVAIDDLSDFSGRVTLRLGPTLHGRTARRADREGVSLNQYLVNAAVHYLATGEAGIKQDADAHQFRIAEYIVPGSTMVMGSVQAMGPYKLKTVPTHRVQEDVVFFSVN